ncbi:MAG: hypothetical protein K8R21_10000 [Leptospira sp.]|nr:hypothetical protein [Leptospira sp.]
MNKKIYISAIMLIFAFLAAGNCSKVKTVAADTQLVENPGEKKPVNVVNGKIKRGEYVKQLEEKEIGGTKFVLVQVEGVSTKGWMDVKNLKEGKVQSVTVTTDTDLFSRPNEKSDKTGTVKAGQVAFKLEESGNFVMIQFPGKEGFVMKSALGSADAVVKSITMPVLGKAILSASSQFSGGEGKELEFDARNIFDGSLQTGWCEGKNNDDGVGETVSLSFENAITLKKILVVNGYAKSESNYAGNNRVASLKVTGNFGGENIIELKDNVYDYQEFELNQPVSGKVINFIINGVHKGKASDTCIGDIKLEGGTYIDREMGDGEGDRH